jgi:hypothetical protein
VPPGQGVQDALVAPPREYVPEAHWPEQVEVVSPAAVP